MAVHARSAPGLRAATLVFGLFWSAQSDDLGLEPAVSGGDRCRINRVVQASREAWLYGCNWVEQRSYAREQRKCAVTWLKGDYFML